MHSIPCRIVKQLKKTEGFQLYLYQNDITEFCNIINCSESELFDALEYLHEIHSVRYNYKDGKPYIVSLSYDNRNKIEYFRRNNIAIIGVVVSAVTLLFTIATFIVTVL